MQNEIKQGELFDLKEHEKIQINLMPDQTLDKLFIIWNKGNLTRITIDGVDFELNKNCIVFVSEFHMEILAQFAKVRVIEFHKVFLGIDTSLNQAGDYLLVFYGYHFLRGVPKIELDEGEAFEFDRIWDSMVVEFPTISQPISSQLIRNSFQRMMLLAQKSHAKKEFDLPIDFMQLKTIREFQYLVEIHFKKLTNVSDYAQILKVPAKKIAELFRKHYHRKPTELIAHRRNLYAQKQLAYTNELVKNIAYELSFSDSQSFSHFFKKMNSLTPESYRQKHTY